MTSPKSILLLAAGTLFGAAAASVITLHFFKSPDTNEQASQTAVIDSAADTEPAEPEIEAPKFTRNISGTCTLTGTVVTSDNAPIPNAAVGIRLGDQPWSAPQPGALTKTDATGRFRIEGIDGALPITLWAAAEGFAASAKERPECEGEETLLLEPGGVVRFTVETSAKKPAKNAEVHLFGDGLWPARIGHTDEAGTLTVFGLAPGDYGVTAIRDNQIFVTRDLFELKAGEVKSVRVPLSPGARHEISVRDAQSGAPIDEATVSVGLQSTTVTAVDADGKASVLCPKDSCTIAVSAEGYLEQPSAPLPPKQRVEIRLDRGASVSGRVTDRDGIPVAGAEIQVSEALGNDAVPIESTEAGRFREGLQAASALGRPALFVVPGKSAFAVGPITLSLPDVACTACAVYGPPASDTDGRFIMNGLPRRRVALTASHPDLIPAGPPVTVPLDVSDTATDVQIVLKAGAKIAVRVFDEREVPVLGAQVMVFDDEDRLIRDAGSDTDGYARFSGLPFGARFEVAFDGYISRSVRADRKMRDDELEISLEPAGRTIHGRVKDARGFGVGDVALTARLTERGRKQVLTAVSAPDGTFSFEGVGDGRYRITADGGDGGGAQALDMTYRDDVKLVLDTSKRMPDESPPPSDAPMIIAPPGWNGDIADIGGEYTNNESVGADNLGVVRPGQPSSFATPAPVIASPSEPTPPTVDAVGTPPLAQSGPFGDADALTVTGPPPGKGGLPIQVNGGPGKVTVSRVAPASRVEAAGLTRGARILAVNGTRVKGPADAKRALQGPIGSVVMLEVSDNPDGSAPYTIIVQRERIP